ncbi:ribosomal protein L4 [Hypoxylon trugodes]|uniref:ribosomal protein L4 n=1 Tax=Hypoxylon trugodes TaxID=326681 RepID=UPI00218FBE7F|nr:ribosomal protein L4 [Hypoxylon trugodes]KAI1390996.1 ribosomal protein L4 [Hypoxylon trugodes]
MASKGVRGLNEALKSLSLSSQTCREAATHRIPTTFTRSMATESPFPDTATTQYEHWRPPTTIPVTIFNFPTMEPLRLEDWSAKHLHLPLRRDILHLAVVYEGDNTRQGTASTKTRWEVAGSHRKMRPQKGTGRSRIGSKQSPMLRGGGKVFGPHPRDFGTELPRKVYDLAWRTALSYRYRRGELIVAEDGMELPLPEWYTAQEAEFPTELQRSLKAHHVKQIMDYHGWGRRDGRSTFITTSARDNLSTALDEEPNYGRALEVEDVDVKNLLESGRLIVEREALRQLLQEHQSDLVARVFVNKKLGTAELSAAKEVDGQVVVA